MIEGIEILNTYTTVISTNWDWSPSGTTAIIIGALIIAVGFFIGVGSYGETDFLIFGITFLGGLILICGFLTNKEQNPVKATVYEVSIQDTVSINDLTEKYDIIKQRGHIYEIIEKQNVK